MSSTIETILRRAQLDLNRSKYALSGALEKLEKLSLEVRNAIGAGTAIPLDIPGCSFVETQAIEVARLFSEVAARESAFAIALAAEEAFAQSQ